MHRIRLENTVFEGRNNAYLLDGAPTTLVDTGVATERGRAELSAGLAERDVDFADVDRVLLTHWHADHAGLAGAIQREGDATVAVHALDAPLVAGDREATRAEEDRRARRFAEWGIPEERLADLHRTLDVHADLWSDPPRVEPFEDGDTFRAGALTLEAVHLPGHAAGLSAFVFERDGRREAFVGDAILPKYTPNVGGADVRVERPLERYVESLARIVGLDLHRAWPGHRDPIDDPTARARTILDHHRERTRRVVDVLREHGPCDAWAVSAHLFGELVDIHVLHGPGEAYAHLDHLRAHGVAVRDETNRYELVDGDADVASLFPETR